jgi:hypothetical protein
VIQFGPGTARRKINGEKKNGRKTEEARGNSYTCIIVAKISVNSPTVFEKKHQNK